MESVIEKALNITEPAEPKDTTCNIAAVAWNVECESIFDYQIAFKGLYPSLLIHRLKS